MARKLYPIFTAEDEPETPVEEPGEGTEEGAGGDGGEDIAEPGEEDEGDETTEE